jgi:hypothetical protein
MKTSPIRHPKFEHSTTVHSWMFKACHGNLTAALLLGYLEGKFHILLQTQEKNERKGWMRLQKFQIKNGCFASDWEDLDLAFDILKALSFLEIDDRGEIDYPLKEGEVWLKFQAKRINEWLEVYQKPVETKLGLFDFTPFLSLLFLTEAKFIEVEVPVEKIVEVVVEREVKTRTIKLDETWIGVARDLFAFWKFVTKHPRSNLQDKSAKFIIDRLKDGYDKYQIAAGVIGITYSDHHVQNKFDHMDYVVRTGKMLDHMISLATNNGYKPEYVQTTFDEYIKKRDSGEDIEPLEKAGKNKTTGNTLK